MALRWRKVPPLAALVLATGLSMALAAFFATAAQAQTSDRVLVSNINQTSSGDHSRTEPLSQRFTAGTSIPGYALKSVVVAYRDEEGDRVSAKVCTVTGTDQPTNTCTDFTGPASFESGDITFTAPGGFMHLARNTKYAVVLTPDESGAHITYDTTSSDDDDPGKPFGWHMADEYRLYNGISWASDNASRALKIRLKGYIIQGAGNSATGAPGITGPAQVGRTLTAQMGNIADPDGLLSDTFPYGYFFQWIRVDSSDNERDITGATSVTYTPVNADLGHTLKLRVRFLDGALTLETRTSAETNPVVPDAAPCPAGSVWCTVLTSGTRAAGGGDPATVGFRVSDSLGSLDDDTFSFDGAGYTVTTLVSGGASAIDLNTAPLLPADGGGLTLHVQKFTGALDLALDDAFGSPHTGANWNWNGVVGTGPGNPVLLRMFRRINERYQGETDAGTRVTVWLSRQAGVSFDAPTYLAYEAGEGAPVTVTLTPAPTSSVTIPIVATGQGGATSADWTGIPASLTFGAGQSSKTFTVTAVEDGAADEGESVELGFGTLPPGVDEGYRTTTTVHFLDRASPGDARLVGGNGLPTAGNEGRLEVFYRGQWGTVCDDRMDGSFNIYGNGGRVLRTVPNHAPTLACELMGKGNKGEVIDLGPYRARDGVPRPIWLDDLRCEEGRGRTGDPPTRLDQCYHAGIGRDNCTHDEDVALRCSTVAGQTVAEPLRVAFVDVPKTGHDGATAFTFRLDFSEAVAITAEDMRDHALEVSGATVTSAVLADGRDDLWEFTLEPSGTDFVAITVSGKDSCSDTGALCTSLGAGLENRLSTVIPYVPAPAVAGLTAEFADVPEEHSGDSYATFRVELLFSKDVKVSNNRMRKRIMKLENATLEEARRIDRRKDYWEFRLRPASHRPVTLSLKSAEECGARDVICTFDGRPLSAPATATIVGPPGMSVADAEVEEGPDAVLDFVVTLDRAPRREVTVNYETEDGTAVADEDYVRANGMLVFAAGETEKTVSVQVLDDAHSEGHETLTLRLGGPVGAWLKDSEAVGTIRNTDPMPQAWLARFGRTVADQMMEAVEGRVTTARSPGTDLTVAGQAFGGDEEMNEDEMREAEARLERLSTWFRGADDEESLGLFETRAVDGRELLAGTSFALTEGTAESGFGALWGRGAVTRFDGREDDLTLDGDVESALLGADFAQGRWAAGLAVGHSRAEGGYNSPQGDGAVESTLTGVYPYGRYDVNDWLSLWGVVGMGTGSLTLTPAGMTPIETDMDLRMAALGGRSVLLEAPADGGLELAVTSDAMAVQTTSDEVRGSGGSLAAAEADVTRLRIGLEGSWTGFGSIAPSFEIGLRQDGGDAETGFGADIGAGLAWTDPERGIAAEVRARGLLTHEDSGFRERGFSGSFAWDPDPASDLGPSLTLRQTVGAQASGGVDALLRPDSAEELIAVNDDSDDLRNRRLEARLGYGLSTFGGRYVTTPALGFGLTEVEREYSHSWRLAETHGEGLVFGLDIEAARRERVTGDAGPEHRVVFGLGWQLEGARREGAALELRLEGAHSDTANDNDAPETLLGIRTTTRW